MNLFVNLALSELSTTSFYVMPVGILSIVSYVRNLKEDVKFIDFNVLNRYLGKDISSVAFNLILKENAPLLVGISVMVAAQFNMANELCKRVKEILPNSVTVVGGAHVSQFPKEILNNCPDIDFVVIGEGEEQIAYIVTYSKTKAHSNKLPDGIACRMPHISTIPKITYIKDINKLPDPAYDILNFNDYLHDTSTWHNPYKADLSLRVPIITSRGCPHLCNFCSVSQCMGTKHRTLSAEKVVNMIQLLHEQNNVLYFSIFDANFAQDIDRVIKICNEIIKRNLKIYIDLPTGVPISNTTSAIVDALASVGLIRTCISVETGDEFIRNKIMLKKVNYDDIFNVINAIRKYPQIFILTDFVIGMPEDTEESLEQSYQLIKELDTDDITISIATPYPNTPLFNQCIKDNLFVNNITTDTLYNDAWYSHSNIATFTIKPYNLTINQLAFYRDKILDLRNDKIALYKKRMIEHDYV